MSRDMAYLLDILLMAKMQKILRQVSIGQIFSPTENASTQ